jgi:hypothetical protein
MEDERKKIPKFRPVAFLLMGFFFAADGIGAGSDKPALFPPLSGWEGPVEIQTFSPETLYHYINGAADLYLQYDFQELQVAEYQGTGKASLTIELYRHRTPTHAFGIYSQERNPAAQFLRIGVQGFLEEGLLVFVAGNFYVKINGSNLEGKEGEILPSIAQRVAGRFGPPGALPAILSAFPEKGKKKNTDRYIAKNFLGYDFLKDGFTADYEREGKKFKLWIIQGESVSDCRERLQRYMEKLGNSTADPKEGTYRFTDPYHGNVELFWRGRNIAGVLGLADERLRGEYLQMMGETLRP